MTEQKQPLSKVALTDTILELSVPSFVQTKKFYSKLGFSVVWEEPPRGLNGYLVMKLNNSILCFFCDSE